MTNINEKITAFAGDMLDSDDGFVERVIAKENYAEDEDAKSFILDIYNLVQNKIPDIIKSNIEIKPSINLSLNLI